MLVLSTTLARDKRRTRRSALISKRHSCRIPENDRRNLERRSTPPPYQLGIALPLQPEVISLRHLGDSVAHVRAFSWPIAELRDEVGRLDECLIPNVEHVGRLAATVVPRPIGGCCAVGIGCVLEASEMISRLNTGLFHHVTQCWKFTEPPLRSNA